MKKKLHIPRYSAAQRSNHWAVVLCFLFAGVSGFALFHPSLFWMTVFVGGPQWARILHPYIGVLMFLLFLFMFFAFAGKNIWNAGDSEWLRQAGNIIGQKGEVDLSRTGKYNGGQKFIFWLFSLCLLVLLLTGLLFWQAWFASSVPIALQRVAVVLHALAAFVLVLGVIVHAYAAIWVKGTFQAMTRGTVSAGWAKYNHPAWYEEQKQKGKLTTEKQVNTL